VIVSFTPEAQDDLKGIFVYVAAHGGDTVARHHTGAIVRFCRSLSHFPKRGVQREDISPGLRLIGYRRQATIVIEVTDTEVRIVRVFGRGRDVEKALLD
jgi:toxin ParE1/3/4